MSGYGVIEKLKREHVLDGFDYGKEDLNRFLKRQAWTLLMKDLWRIVGTNA